MTRMTRILNWWRRWVRRVRNVRDFARELDRRGRVEQELFAAATGARPLPDAAQCRAWAIRLGTPDDLRQSTIKRK